MKTFQDLQEGLQDPNIFKAFFLAGGPGSLEFEPEDNDEIIEEFYVNQE